MRNITKFGFGLVLGALAYQYLRPKSMPGILPESWDTQETDDEGYTEAHDSTYSLFDFVSELGEPDVTSQDDIVNQRREAFLDLIKTTEGTINQPDPYLTLYGYTSWPNTSYYDHPANMGWKGVPLPDEMCRHAGLNPPCKSTAAGAYQAIKPSWNRVAAKIGLPDFSPMSQDEFALELIREKGALSAVDSGDVLTAVSKVASLWASLPGSTAQQNPQTVAYVLDTYNRLMGVA